jgi:hypothetical protein
MAQTPYAPPRARVSDSPEARGPKPASVRRAVQLLWISAVLSAALAGLYLVGAVPSVNYVVDAVTAAITSAVTALIAWKIGSGRNWARWLFVVIFILGSLMFVALLMFVPQAFLSLPGLLQASAVVQFGLQTSALILMFMGASGQWFRARPVAISPSAV